MEEVKNTIAITKMYTKVYMEGSIIDYAVNMLDVKNIEELCSAKYVRAFLKILLAEDTKSLFSATQYYYAVTLLLGREVTFSDKEEALQFIAGVKNEYDKLEELKVVMVNLNEAAW